MSDYVSIDNNIIAPVVQDDETFVRWVRKGPNVVLECIGKIGDIVTYKEVPLVPKPKYTMMDVPLEQVKYPTLL